MKATDPNDKNNDDDDVPEWMKNIPVIEQSQVEDHDDGYAWPKEEK